MCFAQMKPLQCLNVKAGRQCLKLQNIFRMKSFYEVVSTFSQQLLQAVSEKPTQWQSADEENRRRRRTMKRHIGQLLQAFVIWLKKKSPRAKESWNVLTCWQCFNSSGTWLYASSSRLPLQIFGSAHIHTPTLISQSLSHWHTGARAPIELGTLRFSPHYYLRKRLGALAPLLY